ncbi:MAG: hypothetical protein BWX79_02535 [Alphaproteobacteria bacterium ADurb.Bin100]|nr:MAG: hypothetical protein BWX79_02535 [Alphaproteobacteria bacterium ADurb.Bin100]
MAGLRGAQKGQRFGPFAEAVQGDRLHVGIARVVGRQPRRLREGLQGDGLVALAHQQQAQRMVEIGVARHPGDGFAQGLFAVGVAPGLPVGVGQVQVGCGKLGVEQHGPLKGCDRLVHPALAQAQVAQVDVGRRPVRILGQRVHVFLECLRPRAAPFHRDLLVRDVSQHPGGLHAHAANGVCQQWRGGAHARRRVEGLERAGRRCAKQGVGVGQQLAQRWQRLRLKMGLCQCQRGRPHDRRQGGIFRQRHERGQGGHALGRAGVQGAAGLWPCTPAGAVPPVHGRCGPLRLAVGVAAGAGVGRAQLVAQVGAWHADGVVAPGIDHHVVALRHVAFDALGALAAGFVPVVLGRVKNGRVVAACAQRVAVDLQLE